VKVRIKLHRLRFFRDVSNKKEEEIKPWKTAITRHTPSRPLKKTLHLIEGRVLDFGCGKGYDADYLAKLGYDVEKYDKYYFPEKPKGTFDTILCFYVLNVIPADERKEVIKEIGKYLKPKGKVIFAVRTPAEIEREAKRGEWRYVNGYITQRQTFQEGISYDEMVRLAKLLNGNIKEIDSGIYLFTRV